MVNDLIFCKPEDEGLDSARISKFIERLKERKTNLHSFMLVRNGKILTEAYYKPFDKDFMHRLYSSSKTYVSIAVGMLIDEGKIRLEDKIMDLLPEYANDKQHKWMKECAVEDALKMSVPMLTDTYFALDYKEWAWTFFNHPTRSKALKPASTVFDYNTSGSFILDVLVEKITGKPFLEYMRPVFDKIGVSKDIWCVKSPDGYAWGGSGVVCTLRDFAKFAELLLNKGEYKGEQLLPRWYIEKATSKQICNITENHFTSRTEQGYGYQIWITKHGFAMLGMGSQMAFCFPDKNFMFVCQGDTQCNADTDGDYIYEQLAHEIYEYLQDEALPVNHTFDFGIQGLKDTMENLKRVGLPYTGIGENDTDSRKPYIVEQENKKIGFINVCEHEYSYALTDRIGANPFDPFLTMQDIRALKKEVDYVIALYHGGKEHCRYPSPRLRNLCREMVLCGADVVITQHSHCIGCYEEYEGGHIVYGQGNFHFCWNNMPETWYTSLLIQLNIENELKIEFIPLITKDYGIDIAQGNQAKEIMRAFIERNAELQNGKWIDGWRAFCVSMQDTYKGVLRGLCTPETKEETTELFSHFLDCEAHTDVWRELFPTWNTTNEK